MPFDTKTNWPTDRRSQHNFGFDLWVSSARELQLKRASQRGQETLDTEAEGAATKQRDWEH
jgi:hypothetical protein